MSPAMNESPAPMVSATVTVGAVCSEIESSLVTTVAPEPPAVTTTNAGPMIAQARAVSTGERSG